MTERDLPHRIALEGCRAERIERFRKQQRATRDWVEIEKVASDIASPKGRDWISPTSAGGVYAELRASFERGEFEAAGKLKVLFLCPHQWEWGRLTRERLSDLPDDDDGHGAWLQWCWVPRDMLTGWLRRKGIEIPQYMLPVGDQSVREHQHAGETTVAVVASVAPPQVLPNDYRNKTGPKPKLRSQIRDNMLRDYAGLAEDLKREKQETLKSKYGASADTVDKARKEALKQLR